MFRRTAASAAALAALTLAAFCSTASAESSPLQPAPPVTVDNAVPLSPDDAEALATAPAAVSSGETTTPVSANDALAAPRQASSDLALLANPTMCWADRAWWQWGTWPYEQRITNTTFWCAVYGQRITYRSTTVTTSGTLCGTNWRASQLIGGGIGFHGMTIRASAGFSCPTVLPWLTLHPTHYLDVFFGDRGRAVITGHA